MSHPQNPEDGSFTTLRSYQLLLSILYHGSGRSCTTPPSKKAGTIYILPIIIAVIKQIVKFVFICNPNKRSIL